MRCGELGVGSLKPKAVGVDFSLQTGIYENRTVSGNRNPTVDGIYSTMLYNGSATIRVVY
jgi:long-chain fatty acid transport protein